MALADLLKESKRREDNAITDERVAAAIPRIRDIVAFWREYPDLFIDFMAGGDERPATAFHLYFYQRIFLRACMRYKMVYATFPRAFSKSFLSTLILMTRCVLYPGAHLFVTSGGKEQSASILTAKVQEICRLIPAFNNEIDWHRGQTMMGKDYCRFIFKNTAVLDNIAARESSRGQRRHGGLVEECVGVDGEILNNVILPTMNVSRLGPWGGRDENEVLNKSQIFITTAGYKQTYSYDKLIQLLVWQIAKPGQAFIMGGTWRIPAACGLISKHFVTDLKMDGTFNEMSFAREYESFWEGNVEGAFFEGEAFDRNRILLQPEYEYSSRSRKDAYYVLGIDVGRKGSQTVICVLKVTPAAMGQSIKTLVNIYTLDDMHFEEQCITIKKLFYKYKAYKIIIDSNGLGIGLLDYLVKTQVDPATNETLPDFGVENDEDNYYKKYRTPICEQDAVYSMKANAPINTEAHGNIQIQITSGKLKFLIDERVAKIKLLGTRRGQDMTPEERADYLRPFTLTSILKEEMQNLVEETEGLNIILKRSNKRIGKDKFSALEYGLWYIKQEEERKRKRRKTRLSDFLFMN